ncbi:hypothetical protein C8Q74DRAFT_1302527 [Fomes fomentarius]|nr:hypothetical protein C8Q74DRAFT_1302527 [Fomes fomentarius]
MLILRSQNMIVLLFWWHPVTVLLDSVSHGIVVGMAEDHQYLIASSPPPVWTVYVDRPQ